jgi:DNA-directed RNA polymerase subunit RPC12/RpoP
MESLVVECLRCGTTRLARRDLYKRFEVPECPQCGYLGWAPVLELTGADRPAPGEHPSPGERPATSERPARKKRHLLRSRRSAA